MSPPPKSHLLFENLLKIEKYQFWGRIFLKIFFSNKGIKVKALNYTFIKSKYFLNFIFYFLEGFEIFF